MSNQEATARALVPRQRLERCASIEDRRVVARELRHELEEAILRAVAELRAELGSVVAMTGSVQVERDPQWDTDEALAFKGAAWVSVLGVAP